MGLFVNELCKIKASRSIKGITIVFFFFALLAGNIWGSSSVPVFVYGFGVPFIWIFGNGAAGFFLYAAVVAALFASEFELGTIYPVLGSGVRRSSYFLAKVISIFGVTVLIYLSSMCALFLFRCRLAGFGSPDQIFADYGLKAIVFNVGALLALLSYVAVYIFIACLLREAVSTFIASMVLTVLELFRLFRGPARIIMDAIDYVVNDQVLSPDFAGLFTPCICILAISLAAAYLLFLVRDVG